ncbi:MAG: acetylglutamate kinase [Thermoplasmata archaeon]|nr:acetylglutamate kinase [Thermoplasmata archaeon]
MPRSIPLVLKVGGKETDPSTGLGAIVAFVLRAQRAGRDVVVVHGGGEEVTARATELGLPTKKVDGQRVTDRALLDVVIEVLAGRVNGRIVNALSDAGAPAVGLSGLSGRLLPVQLAGTPPGSLGLVGEPTGARVRILRTLLDEGYTPVVAPIGTDQDGGVYNVNADLAAGAIAAGLGADLLLITDVPAVRDASGHPLAVLGPADVARLLASGAARDGMIPKVAAASRAVETGARSAWVGSVDGLADDGPRPDAGTRFPGRGRPNAVPLLPRPAREARR